MTSLPAERTAVVLFTRDLRVHDHPALTSAVAWADRIVPLFVLDDAILTGSRASPNRGAFLSACLADLRGHLRNLGSDLVLRRGDAARETVAVVGATDSTRVYCSADVSDYARRRDRRLRDACAAAGAELRRHPGLAVVPPGTLAPTGGDHYRVFTPYWRAWEVHEWRALRQRPRRLPPRPSIPVGRLPGEELIPGDRSPSLPAGGETAGRRRLARAARTTGTTGDDRDHLAADCTTRLSPYLHFGCVSPLEVAVRLRNSSPDIVRQLAWRDFHIQVTAAFPGITQHDYRDHGSAWRRDDDAYEAWTLGMTGVPIVDAGMRQLLAEGWMHNRARLVTASFLTKTLRLDWRLGERHFNRWLVDGDVAANAGNWQWVAGTGNDTRPNRVLNPLRQARRFDPAGDYVRRYVNELAAIPGPAVHHPWTLPADTHSHLRYPPPIVEV